ncbi:MAG TPA: sugar ABC transporter permease [Mycobacteriales bacterium]|jgi:sorbitol/mannitol transport system permease protein|nr:sugar ABC transporter permease [Mycobacteriales bacterium]
MTAVTLRAAPARRRTRDPEKVGAWSRRLPLLPALVFTVLITQIPFIFTIYYSLKSWNLVRPGSEHWVGVSNYGKVFTDSQFRDAAINTVILTVSAVIIAMLLGTGLALLLDRSFPGRGVVRTLLITPFLVMPTAGALLWKTTILDPVYGLANFVLRPFGIGQFDWISKFPMGSVVAETVWQWTPFMMLIVLAGLQSQPRDVLEAGRVDGAGTLALFREITFPHLRRYIELGVLLGAIYVVNTFDAIYMMTQGGPGTSSTNLPFYLYQRAFLGFDIGQAAALGVVVVVATIIVATFALRVVFSLLNVEEGK